ncbi:MAG: calcium-binding protein, partial [Candidatus Poribacteria bacterium]
LDEADDDEILIDINWDSITLKSMPEHFIYECEEDGLGWDSMILGINDVEPTKSRDKEKDVQKAIDELAKLHAWDSIDEECPSIRKVLKGIDPNNTYACMKAWEKHFKEVLTFPFDAEVTGDGESPLRSGNRVQVNSIAIVDDLYGVVVNVTFNGKKYAYPLCDLEALDKKSSNYQNVRDYVVWFANM